MILPSKKTLYSGTITGLRISSVAEKSFLDACAALVPFADGESDIYIYDSVGAFLRGTEKTHQNTLYIDAFNDLAVWSKLNASVNVTASVATNLLTIPSSNNDYRYTGWGPSYAANKNVLVSFTGKGTQTIMHQIRQSDYDNFILSTVSSTGNFTIMTRDPSDLDTRATVAITGYSSANEYQVVSRVFENQIVSTLLSSAGVFLYQLDYTSAVIAAYTATGNGLGVGGTGTGSGVFSDYKSKKLDKYLNIVCLGDSNTVGSSGESVNPGIENMYPSVLAKQFLYSGVSVINGGVAGDGSADVQARMATDFNVKKVTNATNVCILMVGANDLRDGDTTEQAWTKLGSLIDAILAQSWDALWVVTYPPCVDGPTAGLNALIISNASTKGYNVLDVYPYFDDPAHPGRGLDEYYYTFDYVHLNAAGQAYLASLVVDGIFPFYSDSYTYDETLSGEIRSGTLTNHELYKITATEENHFGTGLVIDDYFTSDGTETCDANNKVKQVLTPSTDGVTLQASKWDATESFGVKAAGFKYNEASYAVRVFKAR